MWTPTEKRFLEEWEKLIQRNSELENCTIRLLVLADRDLGLFGHGTYYRELGEATMLAYLNITSANPDLQLPHMPFIKAYIERTQK